MTARLTDLYDRRVADGDLHPDAAQRDVLQTLEDLSVSLAAAQNRGLLGKVKPGPAPKGVYIWGEVGRGKSMVMDLFFAAVPIKAKKRIHFHAFMQEVHRALHVARTSGAEDFMDAVTDQVAGHLRLLAFDEMQITDITDAMIVGRLFERLFARGVVVVTTSNLPPDGLYRDGLKRDVFLPFVRLLEDRLTICELVSPRDYRHGLVPGAQTYFWPDDTAARAAMNDIWSALTPKGERPLDITIHGRLWTLTSNGSRAVRASFDQLCGQALGAADFLALVQRIDTLLIDGIPRLTPKNYDKARRFVILIDTLYEARIQLFASAADAPENLYTEGEGLFEFSRPASRLREMQSAQWRA